MKSAAKKASRGEENEEPCEVERRIRALQEEMVLDRGLARSSAPEKRESPVVSAKLTNRLLILFAMALFGREEGWRSFCAKDSDQEAGEKFGFSPMESEKELLGPDCSISLRLLLQKEWRGEAFNGQMRFHHSLRASQGWISDWRAKSMENGSGDNPGVIRSKDPAQDFVEEAGGALLLREKDWLEKMARSSGGPWASRLLALIEAKEIRRMMEKKKEEQMPAAAGSEKIGRGL